MPELPLPNGLERPHQIGPQIHGQLCMFPETIDETLCHLRVSRDDLDRWHGFGWLSFRVEDVDEFDAKHTAEIGFLRDLSRSGLSDEQINSLLGELTKPYAYRSDRTAYSFAVGWLNCSPIFLEDLDTARFADWAYAKAENNEQEDIREAYEKLRHMLSLASHWLQQCDETAEPD